MDLVEPLHGDVVVALDEPARDVLVERVGQDPGRRVPVGSVAAHQVVPALLGVEHGRPQLAAGPDAAGLERIRGYLLLDVAEPVEAEGGGQAAGRIDGDDQHPAAEADGGHGRRGRRGGGLADAAGAAHDHDLLGGEERLDGARVGPAPPDSGVRPVGGHQ